jgi:hypothetical protein
MSLGKLTIWVRAGSGLSAVLLEPPHDTDHDLLRGRSDTLEAAPASSNLCGGLGAPRVQPSQARNNVMRQMPSQLVSFVVWMSEQFVQPLTPFLTSEPRGTSTVGGVGDRGGGD